MRKLRSSSGYTLVEVTMAAAILGLVFAMGSDLLVQITRFVRLHMAKAEIQRDARTSLDMIDRELREASASSVVIDQASGQPPYSRITFTRYKSDGSTETISYYQKGTGLYLTVGSNNPIQLSNNLFYLAFSYPETDISTILSVSVTFQKATYGGQSKALQMAVETVRLMDS